MIDLPPDTKGRARFFQAVFWTVDTSQVSVTWLETGRKVILTRRIPETIPTYYAKLRSPASDRGSAWEDYVKEGSEFTLPAKPDLKLALAEIKTEEAHVEFRDADGKLRRSTLKKSK